MTIDQLLTLTAAGFSKSEILALANTQPQPQPQPSPQAYAYAPAPAQMPGSPVTGLNGFTGPATGSGAVGSAGTGVYGYQNTTGSTGNNAGGFTAPGIMGQTGNNAYSGFQQVNNPAPQGYGTDVVKAIQGLTSAVQLSNVQTAGNIVPKKQTTEDIIASIISPEYEGLKDGSENGGKVNG
jgi:hypothetical protein